MIKHKLHKKITNEFKDESLKQKRVSAIMVVLYIILSFVVFCL